LVSSIVGDRGNASSEHILTDFAALSLRKRGETEAEDGLSYVYNSVYKREEREEAKDDNNLEAQYNSFYKREGEEVEDASFVEAEYNSYYK
jgi:hypothetical protein